MTVVDRDSLIRLKVHAQHQLTTYRLPRAEFDLCNELLETIVEDSFPGALLPCLDDNENLLVCAIAKSNQQWRELRPVLNSFAGPTLTGFTGLPQRFPNSIDTFPISEGYGYQITTVIPLAKVRKLRIGALRALRQAYLTCKRAPNLKCDPPIPTSLLLTQFRDHLNMRHRDAACAVLDRLRNEVRLDGLNLRFLTTELLAEFECWNEIVEMRSFRDMIHARQSPRLTTILLKALYYAHIDQVYQKANLTALMDAYKGSLQALVRPAIRRIGRDHLTMESTRMCALELLVGTMDDSLIKKVTGRTSDLDWLESKLSALIDAKTLNDPRENEEDTTNDNFNFLPDTSLALDFVLRNIEDLNPTDRGRLNEYFQSEVAEDPQDMDSATINRLPNSWQEWFVQIRNPDFSIALEIARVGEKTWPTTNITDDPITAKEFTNALLDVEDSEIGRDRFSAALPYFVSWLERIPDFPLSTFVPVYLEVLTLIALHQTRKRRTFASSSVLVNALLDCGVDKKDYHSLLDAVDTIVGDSVGVEMAYWILEVVECFYRKPSPDATVRETYAHNILTRLTPLSSRLSPLQYEVLQSLASEFGWQLENHTPPTSLAEQTQPNAALGDISVAVHSLIESATQKAKELLSGKFPTLSVEVNSDEIATKRLRSLARNADIFVISWQSATHAATDFIRANRRDKPLLYASGKGYTSIIRVIEDHLLQAN